ncbi:MAG: acyl-CoA desaturase [Synechococcaceae bacterium WB6_1A_059]|nr:acyl-CoA desaturase [Synechococcaceae bacterium WB6_1A_059]
MKTLAQASYNYYLYFNLPLHILTFFLAYFVELNWTSFIIAYIIIYWFGIQMGFHKLFSHKSWIPKNKFIKYGLGIIGCFGLMGGPVSWARMHRWHHRHSDTDQDPHSPIKGFYHSYLGWLFNPVQVPIFVVKDFLKDSLLLSIEKRCIEIVVLFLITIGIIKLELLFSILLAMILTFHSEMLINTLLHKRIGPNTEPINNLVFSLFSGGGSLHKNHHENAGSSNFSKKWFEIDLSYFFIKFLQKNENRN